MTSVTLRLERFLTSAQQSSYPLDLVQQRELPGGFVPLARVVTIHPRCQRRECLDLQL
jgi:hypothetical protein